MLSFSYRSFLRRWFQSSQRGRERRTRQVSLRLEVLETRTVPSVTVVPQQLAAVENTPTTISQSQLLSGDSDSTFPLTAMSPTQPSNASLVDNHNGTFTFAPNTNFSGSSTFTYSVGATVPTAESTAADGAANDSFGTSVAINGSTAVIGAPDHAVGANAKQGAAYVFVLSGTTWTLQGELTAADGAAQDLFGSSVSISGNSIIVGAPGRTVGGNTTEGTAYVFVRSGSTWSQQAELTAADGAQGNTFGVSVAINGSTAVVGANFHAVGVNLDQGTAYVYTQSGTTWSLQAELTAADGATNDHFGDAVAISASAVVVGAGEKTVNAHVDQGAAYVFTQSGTTWTERAELTAADGATNDFFGRSVAIGQTTVVIGAADHAVNANAAQGAAYVFVQSGSTWSQKAELTAADGAANDVFGTSVSVDGTNIVVGAPDKTIGTLANQGAGYVFSQEGTSWTQQAEFTAAAGAANDHFGGSLGINGTVIVTGASAKTIGANANQGAAYAFNLDTATATATVTISPINPSTTAKPLNTSTPESTPLTLNLLAQASDGQGVPLAVTGTTTPANATLVNNGGTFTFTPNSGFLGSSSFAFSVGAATPQTALTAFDGAANSQFGFAVSVSGNTAVIGAPGNNIGGHANQGEVYVFVRAGSTWTLQEELTASDGAAGDDFGAAVSVSGDTLLVGADEKAVNGNAGQGTAYVFLRSGTTWSQQAELTAADGGSGFLFAHSVSLSGDTAVVGAADTTVSGRIDQGTAYVFVRSGTTWSQQGPDLTAVDGIADDQFGTSVSVSVNTIVVGAPSKPIVGRPDQGAAYVFVRLGTNWTQQAELTAANGAADDLFGTSVSVSGTTVAVGAPDKTVNALVDQGAAYVFTASGITWSQQAELTASDGAAGDTFGQAVAVSGTTIVVGADAKNISSNNDQGAAYEFVPAGATWTQQSEFTAAFGAANDLFAHSVALSGETAVFGASAHTVNLNTDQGAAYVQELGSATATVSVTVNPPLLISPTSLPSGMRNTVYTSVTFTATGGSGGGYTFKVSGALPAGLTLFPTTGLLSGTPTQAGTFTPTITVTDSSNESSSVTYTIIISPSATGASQFGVVNQASSGVLQWVENSTGTGTYTTSDTVYSYGINSDKPVVGDWNGSGNTEIGVARSLSSGLLEWVLNTTNTGAYTPADTIDFYGAASDKPVVGDWTGSGTTKLGVVRPTSNGLLQWVLDTSGTGGYVSTDPTYVYGLATDTPIVGDWTGNGTDDIGVVRKTAAGGLEWVLNTTGTGSYSAGDTVFNFGAAGDIPVVGDWNNNGKDEIGVVIPQANGGALWVLDTAGTGVYTPSDPIFSYGSSTSHPIVGTWPLPAALYSAAGVANNPVQPLADDAVFQSTVNQAIAAWQQAGLSAQLVQRLETANYSVGTLGNDLLGETISNNVVIDATAQGHGWSESATPQPGQIDLFTALEHEMGHVLGLPDQNGQPNDLMFYSLQPGVRKTASAQDVDAVFASLGTQTSL